MPTPAVDAELLLRHVTGWSRTKLLLARGEELPAELETRLAELAERRADREPLQLLVGSVGFRYIEVEVRPGVFVPRPETEVLAGLAVERTPRGGLVLEPCTGTGAVACSIASESRATVVATDISSDAVALAEANARRLGLEGVQVILGNLLDPVPRELRGRADVVVSNPPYLADAELAGLEPEVVRWDPHAALVSGPTGNEATNQLIEDALTWLRPGGHLLLEVDSGRAARTARRAEDRGLREVAVHADLTGVDRIVSARR